MSPAAAVLEQRGWEESAILRTQLTKKQNSSSFEYNLLSYLQDASRSYLQDASMSTQLDDVATSSRNWDEEFQALLSGCCTSPQEALDLTTKINVLSQEFAAEATKIVTRIVASEAGSGGGDGGGGDAAEEMLPGITRLERRGVAGGCKYTASGMFFKLTTGDAVSYTHIIHS